MDRRQFFGRGIHKAAEVAVKTADARAENRARRWIRPPYAQPELEFLLSCTRCGDCVEACPHGIIFLLPVRVGTEVFNTPALDLVNHGCHMCDGWPCVSACEPAALALPETEGDARLPAPRLASVRINENTCLPFTGPECGACRYICPVPGAMDWHMDRPTVNEARCTGCALCLEACITEPKSIRLDTLRRVSSAGEGSGKRTNAELE